MYMIEKKPKATLVDVNKQSFTDFMEACRFVVPEDLALWSNFTQLQGTRLKFSFQC